MRVTSKDLAALPSIGSWRGYQYMLDGDEGLRAPYACSKIDFRWAQRAHQRDRRGRLDVVDPKGERLMREHLERQAARVNTVVVPLSLYASTTREPVEMPPPENTDGPVDAMFPWEPECWDAAADRVGRDCYAGDGKVARFLRYAYE